MERRKPPGSGSVITVWPEGSRPSATNPNNGRRARTLPLPFSTSKSGSGGKKSLMQAGSAFLLVGSLVAGFGIAMIVWHVIQNRRHAENFSLNADELLFYERQYRRRMQTSALTVTLGAMLALCEQIPAFRASPVFATIYVFAMLLLSLWLIILALTDALASRMHMMRSLRRNRNARKELEAAAEALRESAALDASSPSDGLTLQSGTMSDLARK